MEQGRYPRCEFDARRLSLQLDVSIAADPSNIPPLVSEVMRLVRSTPCVGDAADDVELALSEALANAVVHGARRDPAERVQCCVACDTERGLLVIVRDPGPGFDAAALPSPVRGEALWSSHGRGIWLLNQLMDQVEFRRGGTEIYMRKGGPSG